MFIVMARVSGGITGTREAVLKSNGVEQVFDTREAADARALEMMDTRWRTSNIGLKNANLLIAQVLNCS